jgi:hypothetical protein
MFNNINPLLWGPHCWRFMHYLTMAYPEEPTQIEKDKVKRFFLSLADVIPCENCRVHFALNLKNFPLNDNVLNSRYNLINWLKDIHNEVNIRNGKKIWSYDDIINEYSNKKILDNNDYKVEIVTIFLLFLIIIIILIYVKSKLL